MKRRMNFTKRHRVPGLWGALRFERGNCGDWVWGWGGIVNLTSESGIVGLTNAAAYCGTKYAIVGLTKAATPDGVGLMILLWETPNLGFPSEVDVY